MVVLTVGTFGTSKAVTRIHNHSKVTDRPLNGARRNHLDKKSLSCHESFKFTELQCISFSCPYISVCNATTCELMSFTGFCDFVFICVLRLRSWHNFWRPHPLFQHSVKCRHHWARPMGLYGTLCWPGGGGVSWWFGDSCQSYRSWDHSW